MRRRITLLTAIAALVVGAAFPATASPSVCVDADINLNNEIVIDESLCLPPASGGLLLGR
jgi:hypothetical protein